MKCTVKNNTSTPMMSELFDKRNLNFQSVTKFLKLILVFMWNRALV